jgi:hypothetical protein
MDADDNLNSMQQLQLGMTWILFNIQCVSSIATLAEKAYTVNRQISAKCLEGLICGNILGNLPLSLHYFHKLGDMVDKTKNNTTMKAEPAKFELR